MSVICDAHKKKVYVELLYNSEHRKFNQLEIRCGRENQHPREAGPPGPRLSSPGERGKKTLLWPIWSIWCTMANMVNMMHFCSVSNSLSHSKTFSNPLEPFQIKWEVYFSKELCRSSLLRRRYDYACICIWVCNTIKFNYYKDARTTQTTVFHIWTFSPSYNIYILFNIIFSY